MGPRRWDNGNSDSREGDRRYLPAEPRSGGPRRSTSDADYYGPRNGTGPVEGGRASEGTGAAGSSGRGSGGGRYSSESGYHNRKDQPRGYSSVARDKEPRDGKRHRGTD